MRLASDCEWTARSRKTDMQPTSFLSSVSNDDRTVSGLESRCKEVLFRNLKVLTLVCKTCISPDQAMSCSRQER